ncbi:MAG TPA: DUF1572 family protein [Gemmatimonadaceae bacterium]
MNTAEMIGSVMVRDLRAARREIEAYDHEADLWRLSPTIPNSAGTLALHLAGNMRHFIGTVLGGTKYVRNRDAEFAARDVPRVEVLRELDAAVADVNAVVPHLTEAQLAATFPVPVAGHRAVTEDVLIHLVAHLGYHVGQMDYHRRALTGNSKSIGAMAPGELRSATPAT